MTEMQVANVAFTSAHSEQPKLRHVQALEIQASKHSVQLLQQAIKDTA